MDPHGNIYESEDVNPEDAARLDGYLKARAEADEEQALRKKVAELPARLDAARKES